MGFDDGNLAFVATVTGGTAPGYVIGGFTPSGGLTTLASTATLVPGLATTFTTFPGPTDLSGTTVVFRGNYLNGSGCFTADLETGTITPVVTTSTKAPGGTSNFTGFSSASIDGEIIAFHAQSTGIASGLYLRHEGRLRKVIATGDPLDGKTVASQFITENSLAGGYLAFQVTFTDTTRGIYRLKISELVDAPDRDLVAEKAKLEKKLKKQMKRLTKQLKKARKAGKRSKVKKFSTKLRKIRKQLRQL